MSKPRRPLRRAINGVLLLDKPKGVTSHQALLTVRVLYNADKAGHTGTLDPLATGLLPICFGQATKLTAHLLDSTKRYLAEVRLGEATSTGDSEGETIARSDPAGLTLPTLQVAAIACTGLIQQVPPMYSAIKRDGTRLYQLAREGVEVEREAREVEIHALTVVAFDGVTATLDVMCSKGTYIRTLAEDWAKHFGQVAHLSGLRRLAVGPFGAAQPAQMVTLAALEASSDFATLDRYLLPSRTVIADWSIVIVTPEQVARLDFGFTIQTNATPGWVAMLRESGELLGLGEQRADGVLQPRRWFGAEGV
ncbi:MAG: tRNA pseudouridine(55) synthase TruB [Pseudomonadota bacterium]